MLAVLIGSGEIENYPFLKQCLKACVPDVETAAPLVVCCDGGAAHAQQLGFYPHIIVGDLDSLDGSIAKAYEQEGVRFVKYRAEKDFSDMEIGLNYALEAGADSVVFLGATGSRTDHSLSNIGLLYSCIEKGRQGWIISEECRMTLVNQFVELKNETGKTVSLLPITPTASGIVTTNMKYPLRDESLSIGTTRGISNIITDAHASVSVGEGILLLILQNRLLS